MQQQQHQQPSIDQPWRVLHVLFSKRMAGSERYCVDLANQQAALGLDVHVVGLAGSAISQALSSRVTFHPMRLPLLRGLRVRRLAARLRVDICHAHLSPACKAAAQTPQQVGKVATLHVGYKAHQHARLDGLICVNQAQTTRLHDYSGQQRVIPNWLPSPALPHAAHGAPPDYRSALGLAADTFLVGAVGRLHASKGMDVLIDAFRAVAPANAALLILGEGPQRAALEKRAAGDARIHLLGFSAEVDAFLQQLNLFVSPSREESFGLAILEAMQAGLPMVATAAEGPAEFLRGHPVELVAPGSVTGLSQALARACERLRDPRQRRVRYDTRAFEQAAGIDHVAEFYAQVMQRVRQPQTHSQRHAAMSYV